MKIIDQYHGDPAYAQLHQLSKAMPLLRETLKTASFTTENVDSLPSSAFAWEDQRRFPVHTKEDTAASLLYRSKCASVPDYVDDKLTTAALVFGLTKQHFSKTATATDMDLGVTYALPEMQRLPLNTPTQIKTAEVVLERDYKKLPLEKRADAFSRMALAAKTHSVPISEFSTKMAGLCISHTPTLRSWLGARSAASIKHAAVSEAFDQLEEGLRGAPEYVSHRASLVKLASTIQQLDTAAGLEKHYDRKLPDPMLTVFNKAAADMLDVAGAQIPVTTLISLPESVWEQLDVPELAPLAAAQDVQGFTEVFETLPLDIKVALRTQLGQ